MTRHSTAWFDARRLLLCSLASAGLYACGAAEGGQSGTDSLEAIGVNKPLAECNEDNTEACTEAADADNGEGSGDEQNTHVNDGPTQPAGSSNETEVAPTSAADTGAAPDDNSEQFCEGDLPGPSIGGSNGVYIAKDPEASVCVTPKSSTSLCMTGWTVDAGENYENWGGGFGLVMASELGADVTPFDATSLGITAVKFTISGVDGFVLRAYLNQVDDPTIEDDLVNFQANSFVLMESSSSGAFTLPLVSAALPPWTLLDPDGDGTSNPDVAIDLSKLNSLQFFIAANVGPETGFEFDVCVTDLEWLDANGDVVIPAE